MLLEVKVFANSKENEKKRKRKEPENFFERCKFWKRSEKTRAVKPSLFLKVKWIEKGVKRREWGRLMRWV